MNKQMNFKHSGKTQNKFDSMSCYGNRYKVSKGSIKAVVLVLAVAIPVIFPVPLAMAINKMFVKSDIVMRYN